MKKSILIMLLAGLFSACTHKEKSPLDSLPDMSAVRANLAFTCVHEADHLSQLDPEAEQLFQYGRYLQKKEGPKNFNEVARYYRIAAAHGHYKANSNLQELVSQGIAESPDAPKETIDLAAQLVNQGIPGGYYDIGHYLELGYGLKQDAEMALRYMRKAADLGSPDAQFYVGQKLAPIDNAPAIARQMHQCAADQGHSEAAFTLGMDLKTDKIYPEAVRAFQKAAAAGSPQGALSLEAGFSGVSEGDSLSYIGVSEDVERARRYRLIRQFIRGNDGRNPKVPDIDKIVPLPPAKLPPWDGTFQWEKDQAAAVPPQKPSDELIERLSQAKHLDPATGLPLAKPAQVAQAEMEAAPPPVRLPLGTVARTGESCPQDGVWCVSLTKGMVADAERSFLKGMPLPSLTIYQPRRFAWMDNWMGVRQQTVPVAWKLVGYLNEA
ncbi:sel1 repeat family protein [Ralstonia solanacearum]|uniref:Putative Sel1-like lipoprotein n=2 Tax=Ralstonia solanacearum TaxID=305 RepID=F6G3J7_RALS8|nr:sel1 repeat family protein [Ralstonia solanacearum]AEG69765.1 putative Sel1-like lipoprotein [Ralstonia solanacearum Po82]MCG3575445.1 sel1 repeat family protein [Ralstonia solanacearum]MCL9828250.1 sel1 repeat family protein [Ralstonia solanacearum]MCL9833000.1 sel1 repeat family protein [Ralstonia solanacearum]MCL9837781.1 sel1 repeat family protein [Ralstonia solanacearum]